MDEKNDARWKALLGKADQMIKIILMRLKFKPLMPPSSPP
jgi:hypothetical protein